MSSTELPGVRSSAPSSSAQSSQVGAVRLAEGEQLRTDRLPGLEMNVRVRPALRSGLPPALFVHGLGGSSQNWSALMERLAGSVEGEALDLPGFGWSPPPADRDYSITGHARAVIRHLDAAGRGPVHLFGNSLGGAVSTRVAAVRPDLVRTLTLVSPALPELRVQKSAVPTALLALPGMAGFLDRLTRGLSAEQRTRGLTDLLYGDPSRVKPEVFEEAVEEMERRLALPYFWDALSRSSRGIVDAYTLGGQHGLWRQAQRVLAPTLLVYGGRDQLVSYRMARKAAAAYRGSRLLCLPQAGHVAMMEYPEVVEAAFRDLLDATADGYGAQPDPGAADRALPDPAAPEHTVNTDEDGKV
ncbi:alpha/beta fold hydrolase [Streptomyces sp. NPDC051563]|uniref:alpha/beta fold hydrolase n=1 Tax=Streptomyces sp. NPDC051563 TaxID=3365659 RepID=UPI0037A5AF75